MDGGHRPMWVSSDRSPVSIYRVSGFLCCLGALGAAHPMNPGSLDSDPRTSRGETNERRPCPNGLQGANRDGVVHAALPNLCGGGFCTRRMGKGGMWRRKSRTARSRGRQPRHGAPSLSSPSAIAHACGNLSPYWLATRGLCPRFQWPTRRLL